MQECVDQRLHWRQRGESLQEEEEHGANQVAEFGELRVEHGHGAAAELPIWAVELRGQVRCQRCPKVLNNGVGQRSTEASNRTKKPQSERERGQP